MTIGSGAGTRFGVLRIGDLIFGFVSEFDIRISDLPDPKNSNPPPELKQAFMAQKIIAVEKMEGIPCPFDSST
jgi:hypothetical protein